MTVKDDGKCLILSVVSKSSKFDLFLDRTTGFKKSGSIAWQQTWPLSQSITLPTFKIFLIIL